MFSAGRSKKLHTRSNNPNKKINKNKNKVIVCLVHANWCGHCQHLMPEWNKMEQNIKNDSKINSKCEIVKIESENIQNELPKYERLINDKIQVEGYPSIFLIKDRKIEKYNGERTATALGGWVAGATNGHFGGKKTMKTRKTKRKSSKKNCKSCKSFSLFNKW